MCRPVRLEGQRVSGGEHRPAHAARRAQTMDTLTIRWNYINYLVFVNPSSAGAVVPFSLKEEGLRAYLHRQGVPPEVIDQVVETVPHKGSVTLHHHHIVPDDPQRYAI